jgi:hypothetical protein
MHGYVYQGSGSPSFVTAFILKLLKKNPVLYPHMRGARHAVATLRMGRDNHPGSSRLTGEYAS